MALTVPKEFGFVLFTGCLMGFQCVLTGGMYVGPARGKAFNADFYAAAKQAGLLEEHKKATGEDKLPGNGYPDMGSGRYSALLPYSKWLAFNNAQRAHGNYVEGIASALVLLLTAGVYNPRWATILGMAYVVGRQVYASGCEWGGGASGLAWAARVALLASRPRAAPVRGIHADPPPHTPIPPPPPPPPLCTPCADSAKGAGARMAGAVIFDVGLVGLLGLALHGSFTAAGGASAFVPFIMGSK